MAARVWGKQVDQKAYHDVHSRVRQFSVGQSVMVRNFRDGPHWVPGIVENILVPLSYTIQVQSRQIWKHHLDHICEASAAQRLGSLTMGKLREGELWCLICLIVDYYCSKRVL